MEGKSCLEALRRRTKYWGLHEHARVKYSAVSDLFFTWSSPRTLKRTPSSARPRKQRCTGPRSVKRRIRGSTTALCEDDGPDLLSSSKQAQETSETSARPSLSYCACTRAGKRPTEGRDILCTDQIHRNLNTKWADQCFLYVSRSGPVKMTVVSSHVALVEAEPDLRSAPVWAAFTQSSQPKPGSGPVRTGLSDGEVKYALRSARAGLWL